MAISIERNRLSLLAATALALVLAAAPAGAADENGTGNSAAVESPDDGAGNALGGSGGGEFAESDAATQETASNASDEDADADDAVYNEEEDADTADNDADDTDVASNEEELVVTAPRHRQRGEYGAPIRTVTRTQNVSFADLDLTTDDGADALEVRIRSTARTLCRQLEIMHPVAADDSPPCYQTAVADGMAQAEDAIAQARDE